jgi:hypothetical protein
MANVLYTPTLAGQNLPPSVASVRTNGHYVERLVDIATAVTIKGSALAAADVIQAIAIPNESIVLAAGCELITPFTATTTTVGIGTTVAASGFVTGFDCVAGAANAYAPANTAAYPLVLGSGSSGGTIDVTLSTLTGTLSAGVLRVFAYILDVKDARVGGVTSRKS